MLCLGNYGQLINTIETEILDELEKLLTKGRNTEIMKLSDIFKTWLSVYLFGCLQMHLRTQKQNSSLLNDSTVLFRRCRERFSSKTLLFLLFFTEKFYLKHPKLRL